MHSTFCCHILSHPSETSREDWILRLKKPTIVFFLGPTKPLPSYWQARNRRYSAVMAWRRRSKDDRKQNTLALLVSSRLKVHKKRDREACRPIVTEVNRDSGSTYNRVSFLGYVHPEDWRCKCILVWYCQLILNIISLQCPVKFNFLKGQEQKFVLLSLNMYEVC